MKNSGYTYSCKRVFNWIKLFDILHNRFLNKPYCSELEKSINTYVYNTAYDNYRLLMDSPIMTEKVWGVINRNCLLIDQAISFLEYKYDYVFQDYSLDEVKKFTKCEEPEL